MIRITEKLIQPGKLVGEGYPVIAPTMDYLLNEVYEWLEDNCRGKYGLSSPYMIFFDKSDAALFKMRWL